VERLFIQGVWSLERAEGAGSRLHYWMTPRRIQSWPSGEQLRGGLGRAFQFLPGTEGKVTWATPESSSQGNANRCRAAKADVWNTDSLGKV